MFFLATNPIVYNVILLISGMVLVGMFVGRLAERHRIPNVTGYLTLGIITGIILSLLGYTDLIDVFILITTICLGFIAFSIGLELDFKKLKSRHKEVFVVTLTQALLTFIITAVGLWVFRLELHIALILGAIGIATEPGPILQMTKRYKTKGVLTDTLVPLHGVEDAFAILLFGAILAFGVSVEQGNPITFISLFQGPILELVFSIGLAILIGFAFRTIIRQLRYEDYDKDLVVFVTLLVTILVSIALANRGLTLFGLHIHLSPILLPMGVGIVFANLSTHLAKHETEAMLDQFFPPIMITFFTIVGAEIIFLLYLETTSALLTRIVLYASVYIVFRIIGKVFGSYLGGVIASSSVNLRKYLGFCLLPQAQAAIGLAFYARSQLSNTEQGNLILIVVIIGTLVYELLGPFGLRHSFIRCEEVDPEGACVIKPKIKHRKHQ